MSQPNSLTILPSGDNPLKEQINKLLAGGFVPEGKTEPLPAIAQAALARRIGVNASVISNWRSARGYAGNVTRLEKSIADFIKLLNTGADIFKFEDDPEADSENFFETPVVKRVWKSLGEIKRNHHLGAIESVPGLGKSVAVREFLSRKDPLGVLITLSLARHGGYPAGIQEAFMDAPNVESGGFRRKKTGRSKWICDRFKDSDRLVIIDNAETLTHSGLDWVLSFYDDTRCPMALVGNVELHKTISMLERSIGRVYPYTRIDFVGKANSKRLTDYADTCAQHYLMRHWPEAAEDAAALGLAREIIQGSGHFRSLQKVVDLALLWIADHPNRFQTPEEAMRASLDRHATHRRKG